MLERVKPGKKTEIETIMAENFKRQDEGRFTSETVPRMIALLCPECVEEFKRAAAHMEDRM